MKLKEAQNELERRLTQDEQYALADGCWRLAASERTTNWSQIRQHLLHNQHVVDEYGQWNHWNHFHIPDGAPMTAWDQVQTHNLETKSRFLNHLATTDALLLQELDRMGNLDNPLDIRTSWLHGLNPHNGHDRWLTRGIIHHSFQEATGHIPEHQRLTAASELIDVLAWPVTRQVGRLNEHVTHGRTIEPADHLQTRVLDPDSYNRMMTIYAKDVDSQLEAQKKHLLQDLTSEDQAGFAARLDNLISLEAKLHHDVSTADPADPSQDFKQAAYERAIIVDQAFQHFVADRRPEVYAGDPITDGSTNPTDYRTVANPHLMEDFQEFARSSLPGDAKRLAKFLAADRLALAFIRKEDGIEQNYNQFESDTHRELLKTIPETI